MRFFRYVLFALFALYALAVLAVFFFGETIAFVPPKTAYEIDWPGYIAIETREGETVAARWSPRTDANKTVLFAHGNAEDLANLSPVIRGFNEMGYSVLVFDYAGYGRSAGKPSEEGLYASSLAAWDFLTNIQKIAPENIVVVGYSMGGASACYLASVENPAGIVLISAFASPMHVMAPFDFLPWNFLNNRAWAKNVKCPVLLIHGTMDKTVPYRNAPLLAKAFRSPARLITLAGYDHFGILPPRGNALWRGIGKFINTPAALEEISFSDKQ